MLPFPCLSDRSMRSKVGMSERSLQRRITEEGSTLRQLLNETRHYLVRKHLGDNSVEIEETPYLLATRIRIHSTAHCGRGKARRQPNSAPRTDAGTNTYDVGRQR